MNKTELIKAVAAHTGCTQTATAELIDTVLLAITAEVTQRGGEVALAGFGTFSLSTTAARTARNPSTGATISVPVKKRMRFKASKTLTIVE